MLLTRPGCGQNQATGPTTEIWSRLGLPTQSHNMHDPFKPFLFRPTFYLLRILKSSGFSSWVLACLTWSPFCLSLRMASVSCLPVPTLAHASCARKEPDGQPQPTSPNASSLHTLEISSSTRAVQKEEKFMIPMILAFVVNFKLGQQEGLLWKYTM